MPASGNGGRIDHSGWGAERSHMMIPETNTNEDRFLDLGLDLNESSCLAAWGLMLSLPTLLPPALLGPLRTTFRAGVDWDLEFEEDGPLSKDT